MNAKKPAAFTLLEVLIATCILSFLILGLYFLFEKSHSAWKKGNARLRQYQKVRGCVDILTRELKTAFISPANPSLLFKGKEDEILFTSSSNLPHQKGEYDLKQIHYQLKDSKLIRKVKSNFSYPTNLPATTILASKIDKLTFSYYDGKKWHSEWGAKKDKGAKSSPKPSPKLPRAVGIKLVVREEGEVPVSFFTSVNIPVNNP